MNYFDDKPKRNFGDTYGEKPKNDYTQPERGGCLSVFIGFVVVANILMIGLMALAMAGAPDAFGANASGYQMLFLLQIGISGVILASAVGLWQWKSWGYYGLLVMYGITIAINLLTSGLQFVAGGLIGMAVLVYLMREKTDYLE